MILVTGAAGFIGDHLSQALTGTDNIAMCDVKPGYRDAPYWLERHADELKAVFHLGAISNTTCENKDALRGTNYYLPQRLADFCKAREIPFIYASSAAVYGNGDKPLNPYAWSKYAFDFYMEWANFPPKNWYGLRFFNIYGNGEAHKGKQASVVSQMLAGSRTLFDIDATRDFVHVDDVVSVMLWLWKNRPASGIYDVGTGVAEPFEAIPMAIAKATGQNMEIKRVPFPDSLKGKYQMHTQADLTKLRAAGYSAPFLSLEDGVVRMVKPARSASLPPDPMRSVAQKQPK